MSLTDESSSDLEERDSGSGGVLERGKDVLGRLKGAIIGVLLWARSSFLRFILTLGSAMGALALAVEGVMAGMLAVWSISAFIFAFLGLGFLKLIGYN